MSLELTCPVLHYRSSPMYVQTLLFGVSIWQCPTICRGHGLPWKQDKRWLWDPAGCESFRSFSAFPASQRLPVDFLKQWVPIQGRKPQLPRYIHNSFCRIWKAAWLLDSFSSELGEAGQRQGFILPPLPMLTIAIINMPYIIEGRATWHMFQIV